MPTVSELRGKIERETPQWLAETNLAKNGQAQLETWLADKGRPRMENSIPSYHSYIYFEEIRRYTLATLTHDSRRPSLPVLGDLLNRSFMMPFGILYAKPNKGTEILPVFGNAGFYFSLLLTLGWRGEAELAARLYFKFFPRIKGHALFSLPWFMLDLCRDWLGAKVDLRDGDRTNDLQGGWSELFRHWREPDPLVFAKVLNAAADYHLEESHPHVEIGHDEAPGYVDDHYEIEPPEYWLFPVELFAVLRLREWEGLENPVLTHPLFTHTPLGRMPAAEPRVSDRFLDEVESKFRSIFPLTPTLADLPALRAEQSSRPAGM